jgi:ubiquinone/menaquinone biosynthesis C-methylase UbiE
MHRFDPKDAVRLDNEWRRSALPPHSALEALGLRETDTVLDVGCGIGYLAFPAADFIGPTRKVYAMDVSEAMLDEMDRRVHVQRVPNVVVFLSDGKDWKLGDASVTFVLCSTVLHEVDDTEAFLKEAKRVLKPGGRIGIVEWVPGSTGEGRGPSPTDRLDPTDVSAKLLAAGFTPQEPIMISESHYCLSGELVVPPKAESVETEV